MLRDAFSKWRCIIPASGFFEWTGGKGEKVPYLFTAGDGSSSLASAPATLLNVLATFMVRAERSACSTIRSVAVSIIPIGGGLSLKAFREGACAIPPSVAPNARDARGNAVSPRP